jgi:hypothetical protein
VENERRQQKERSCAMVATREEALREKRADRLREWNVATVHRFGRALRARREGNSLAGLERARSEKSAKRRSIVKNIGV